MYILQQWLGILDVAKHLIAVDHEPVSKADKIAVWERKSLHGRHRLDLQQPHVDMKASNAWLQGGELFPETEGFMIAIQDQVIDTGNYQKFIIRRPNYNDSCRRCHGASETIQHITVHLCMGGKGRRTPYKVASNLWRAGLWALS
ncbi:hypothetical protein B5X24_HaOG213049 [Helicoverpa armigera]|nr:hypothetical protein B5X24_HaOG213049 [Helicoverpa armigera]